MSVDAVKTVAFRSILDEIWEHARRLAEERESERNRVSKQMNETNESRSFFHFTDNTKHIHWLFHSCVDLVSHGSLSLSLSLHVCARDAFVFVCECACVCAWIRVQHGSHLNNNLNWIYIFKLNIKRKVHYHLHNPPLRMCFYWVNKFTYSIVKERCRLPNFTVICAINSTDLQWVSFLFITHGVCQ